MKRINKLTILVLLFSLLINFNPLFSIKKVAFYYGWLNTTNLDEFKDFDFVIVADMNKDELMKLKNKTKVFLYYPFGSLYNKEERREFKRKTIDFIKNYSFLNGFFFDEIDTGYFPDKKEEFNRTLKNIIDFAHSKGLKVIINGQRFFANYADYYLWESFLKNNKGKFLNFFSNKTNGWESNYDKYLYLKQNNLLNRTIVLFYGVKKENVKLAFLIAQAFNFSYFAYCNNNCFATSKPVVIKLKPENIKKVAVIKNKGLIITTNDKEIIIDLNKTYKEQKFVYQIKKLKKAENKVENYENHHKLLNEKLTTKENLGNSSYFKNETKLNINLSSNFSSKTTDKPNNERIKENNFLINLFLKIKEFLFSLFS